MAKNSMTAKMSRADMVSLLNGMPTLDKEFADYCGLDKFRDENGERCINLKFQLENGQLFYLLLKPE